MFVEKTTEKSTITKFDQSRFIHSHSNLLSRLRLLDYATFIYLGILAVILLFFHRGVNSWPFLILGHFFVVGLLLFLINYTKKNNASRVLIFFRDAYPIFLYTFMFKEVSIIVNIFFPFWFESWLIKWDLVLFGNHPTVWVENIFRPWLTEWMAFSYWSYYLLIPITGIILYVRKNKSLFHSYIFNLSFTLYICYFLFLFLAARGPHETLAHLHSERLMVGFFDHFVHAIQNQASISGAAFPSSHVAAVWIAWIYLLKFKKWAGWFLSPLIISLSISVVYMQYHYAVDSMAGIVLVFVTFPLARLLEKNFARRKLLLNRVKQNLFHEERV